MQVTETKYWGEYFSQIINPDEDPNEPFSNLIYPVVDSDFIVATVAMSIYWRNLIKNILPESNNNNIQIVIVFSNPCSSSFTYQVE